MLASGGVDSSTLLWLCAEQGIVPSALFVDYGQAAAQSEGVSVAKLCDGLRVPWRQVRYSGSRFGPGEIRGRNAYLLHTALMEFPAQSGVVALGIHAGTGYDDCSPEFIDAMQLSYQTPRRRCHHDRGTFPALDETPSLQPGNSSQCTARADLQLRS